MPGIDDQISPDMRQRSPDMSVYDVEDDSETGFSAINHKRRRQARLLFTKSKVYLHPSPSAKDNVAGHLAILEQRAQGPKSPASPEAVVAAPSSASRPIASSIDSAPYLLAWLPEGSLGSDAKSYAEIEQSENQELPKHAPRVSSPPTVTCHSSSVGTTAFAIPIAAIYSLIARPPNSGWWHGSIVINARDGEAFPPLFFHDAECQKSTADQRSEHFPPKSDHLGQNGRALWGGDQVLTWLKHCAKIERSPEPTIYLVNPTHDDKKGFGRPTPEKVAKALQGEDSTTPRAVPTANAKADPLGKVLKEAKWTFLEKLSQVTTFTRRTAQAVAENEKVPIQVRRIMQNPEVKTVQSEFDSARVYLARWAMGIAEQSERDRVRTSRTVREALEFEDSELGDFEILDAQAQSLLLDDKRNPVTKAEWDDFFDSKGRLQVTPEEVKARIFHGGLSAEPSGLRAEAWLFLLGVYDWNSTKDERRGLLNSLNDEFVRLKGQWWDRLVDEEGTAEQREWWQEQKMRIEKDVHRTDRHLPQFAGEDIPHPDPDSPFADIGTNVHLEQMKDLLLTYNEHNKSLGYVQGMSDLLAPIYVVMQDDAKAFWAFVNFMKRMERNFLRDQSGMRLQLNTLDQLVQLLDPKLYLHLQKLDSTNFFFFFRPLLVWYKREFEFGDILTLWERLWTDHMSSNFHIFIAMAVLEKHRSVIMDHLEGFDEVLKYINELANTIDLESTLTRAEALFIRFQRTVEAIDKKHNFPSPSRGRKASSSVEGPQSYVSTAGPTGVGKGKQRQTAGSGGEPAAKDEQTISPELRALLGRTVIGHEHEATTESDGR